jgi:hypothetical protein
MERTNIGLLLAKIESSYGGEVYPTGANVIAVTREGVNWAPQIERATRSILDGSQERITGHNTMPTVTLSFRVELRGNRTNGGTDTDITSGDVAQALTIDPLLRACDLLATYTAESTNGARDGYVTYTPTIPAAEGSSVTFHWYSGGKLHRVIGAKGTVKGVLEAGKMAYLDFEFRGLIDYVVDAAIPDGSYSYLSAVTLSGGGSGYQIGNVLTLAGGTGTAATVLVTATHPATDAVTAVRVLSVGKYTVAPSSPNAATGGGGTSVSLTVTFQTMTAPSWLNTKPPLFSSAASTIGSYSPVFSRLEFDLGNNLIRRDDANSVRGIKGFAMSDRMPKASINPESVAEASNPIWADLIDSVHRTISAVLGTDSGNRIALTLKGSPENVAYGDSSGNRITSISYDLCREELDDAANEILQLKFY